MFVGVFIFVTDSPKINPRNSGHIVIVAVDSKATAKMCSGRRTKENKTPKIRLQGLKKISMAIVTLCEVLYMKHKKEKHEIHYAEDET